MVDRDRSEELNDALDKFRFTLSNVRDQIFSFSKFGDRAYQAAQFLHRANNPWSLSQAQANRSSVDKIGKDVDVEIEGASMHIFLAFSPEEQESIRATHNVSSIRMMRHFWVIYACELALGEAPESAINEWFEFRPSGFMTNGWAETAKEIVASGNLACDIILDKDFDVMRQGLI